MNILKRSDTDLLAHAMVNVFSTTGHIFKFLLPVIEDEVETTGLFLHILFTHLHTAIPLCAIVDIFFCIFSDLSLTENSGTLFRGNCLASKILSSYSVSVGKDFLKELLQGPINSVIHEPAGKFEVNPLKLSETSNVEENIQNLRKGLQTFMDAILQSISFCPL